MPGVGMFIVILVGMFLTGAVAFYIARNVEHGEARFGPDGQLAPYEPEEEEEKDWGVTVKRSEEGRGED